MTTQNQLPVTPESVEQQQLMVWASFAEGKYPDIKLLHHIPNGGFRNKGEAGRLKAEGVKAGVPDLFLPSPHGLYHGMYIEMKAKNGAVSKHQEEWIKELTQQGYLVKVCYGFEEAKEALEEYLDLPKR